jgi:hypothetical protein
MEAAIQISGSVGIFSRAKLSTFCAFSYDSSRASASHSSVLPDPVSPVHDSPCSLAVPVGHAFDGAAQQDAGVVHVLQLHGLLPARQSRQTKNEHRQ